MTSPKTPPPENPVSFQSAGYFETVGVVPLRGRTFEPQDELQTPEGVAILTHRSWVQRFGEDENIIGKTLHLNDRPHRIVGVMPPGFFLPGRQPIAGASNPWRTGREPLELWVPAVNPSP
jgi:hypothetical protein